MNKKLPIFALVLSLFFPTAGYAAGAGLTADNPLHFLDTFSEKVNVIFSANQETKSKKLLEIRKERLEELKVIEAKKIERERLLKEKEEARLKKLEEKEQERLRKLAE